jgi:hypothetical protein
MAEQDSLSDFDFNKVSKPGKFLKFEAGKPITVRILTKDPVVQQREFTDKKTGDINLRTSFCFIVWNFTDERAQILSAGPSMARTFQTIGKDEDFGANLQKCDIKISPEGEMLNRAYDINVLRHSGSEKQLTTTMVDEARQIDLDNDVQDNRGRLSSWEPSGVKPGAKATASQDGVDDAPEDDGNQDPPANPDVVIEDIGDEPINLDDIPF